MRLPLRYRHTPFATAIVAPLLLVAVLAAGVGVLTGVTSIAAIGPALMAVFLALFYALTVEIDAIHLRFRFGIRDTTSGRGGSASAVKRPGRGQIGAFLGRADAAQNGVAMREAAKADNQVTVMAGEAQTLLQAGLLMQPHRAFLVGQRLAVHERQVQELALDRRQGLIEATGDGPIRDRAGGGLGGEALRLAPEQIQRELIQDDDQGQRPFGGGFPVR